MRGRTLTEGEVEQTRAALTALALRIVDTEGREEASLRRVAAEAGISRSTPYTYFADKDALLDAVRVAAIGLLSEGCEAGLAAGQTVAERLRNVGRAYVRFALEHPNLYDLIFEANRGGPEQVEAANRYRRLSHAPLVEAYAQGLVNVPPETLATVLWASTHGMLSLHRAGKLGMGLDEALQIMGDTLAFGYLPRAKEAS